MEDSAIVPEAPVKLWLPGLGAADSRVRAVARKVRDYDEALRLARHEVTGDWVVVIGDQGHPVYGFGTELPLAEDVEHILGKHDIKRHGRKLMDQLAREAERRRLDDQYRAGERDGVLAEHLEHGFRKQGAHTNPRVFIPRGLS